MNHSLALHGCRSQLVKQLVYFDEEKINFLDQYVPNNHPKRAAVERMLANYTQAVGEILADFSAERVHSVALIGSRLELQYEDDDAPESFTIVFPHKANPDQNLVSFLSPLGFQLLLAKPGQTCRLEIPSGHLTVCVRKIRYVNSGDVE